MKCKRCCHEVGEVDRHGHCMRCEGLLERDASLRPAVKPVPARVKPKAGAGSDAG